MYSRKTYEGQFRIPEHYSGTAFRNISHISERDAVGRPSALPERQSEAPYEKPPLPIRKKAPLPRTEKPAEEVSNKSEDYIEPQRKEELPQSFKGIGNDEIIISALLLSLLDGSRDKNEDVTLIILILLLIL